MKTMKKIVAIMAVALMLCSILPLSVFAADTYELATSIEVGDTVVLAYKNSKMELSGISTTSTKYGIGVAYTNAPTGAYALIVEEGYTSGTYSFKCPNGQYLYWTSGNSLNTYATKNANTSWKVSFSGDNAVITNAKDSSRKIQWNTSSPRFACYTGSQSAVQLYKLSGGEEPPVECEHEWDNDCDTDCNLGCGETREIEHDYVEDIIDATCTQTGTATYECSVCGHSYDEEIAMLPHNYVDGACTMCGAEEPAITEVTIDFSTTAQRVSLSTTQQVWQNGGLKLTNNKASSTSNVADYSNPARFYKSSTITIECAGMTSLVIAASGSNSDWAATLDNANLTYTKTSSGYTITFDAPTDSITLTCDAQVRAYGITAVVEKQAEPDCEHDYVGVETQAPTCTVPGVTTYTCSKCQDAYTDDIAVIPHDYVVDIIDATCTATGTKTYECSVCFNSYDETIPMKAHNYVDDVCADCGAAKAYKGTITFDANKTQRTEYSTQIQVWKNEGLTLTNNKLSGNNIGDYSAPVRIYKSSQIIIEFPEMAKLIIDATGIGNDYLWDDTLDGYTYTVENGVYTITFDEPVNSITLTAANQVRAYSITAVVAHEHTYDNAFDTDCNKCGDIRAVAGPVSYVGKSVSEDVNGLAMLFNVEAEGIVVKEGTFVQADFTNATYNGYKLLGLGVIASNGNSETNIEGLRMYDLEDGNAKFAFRVINIPADKLDVAITMTPYYVVEIDGVATTLYGEAQVASYNGALNG